METTLFKSFGPIWIGVAQFSGLFAQSGYGLIRRGIYSTLPNTRHGPNNRHGVTFPPILIKDMGLIKDTEQLFFRF